MDADDDIGHQLMGLGGGKFRCSVYTGVKALMIAVLEDGNLALEGREGSSTNGPASDDNVQGHDQRVSGPWGETMQTSIWGATRTSQSIDALMRRRRSCRSMAAVCLPIFASATPRL